MLYFYWFIYVLVGWGFRWVWLSMYVFLVFRIDIKLEVIKEGIKLEKEGVMKNI